MERLSCEKNRAIVPTSGTTSAQGNGAEEYISALPRAESTVDFLPPIPNRIEQRAKVH